MVQFAGQTGWFATITGMGIGTWKINFKNCSMPFSEQMRE
jgi:hypothetical protein